MLKEYSYSNKNTHLKINKTNIKKQDELLIIILIVPNIIKSLWNCSNNKRLLFLLKEQNIYFIFEVEHILRQY